MTRDLTRLAPLAVLLALTAASCGDADAGSESAPGSPSSTSAATSPWERGWAEVEEAEPELRVVRTSTASSSPDSASMAQLEDLDCADPPAPPPPSQVQVACDSAGVGYVLEPAALVGGVSSAEAGEAQGAGPVVTVELDDAAAADLATLTERLARTGQQLAVVLGSSVLAAPAVVEPITGGMLQIAGDYTADQAAALADALGG